MRSRSWLSVDAGGRRPVGARIVLLGLLAVSVIIAIGLLVGCSNSPPPEDTLGEFGAAVGTARQDEMDFEKLKSDWATPQYGADQQSQQALFALFMAAKAADQALNQPKVDWITYEKGKNGDNVLVTFKITPTDGTLFSAVNLSTVTVELSKTDDTARPWRIQAVTLGA